MRIAIKRIYDDPAPEDGTRVLVDRLWPRGMSKEAAEIDLWAKNLAPSTDLRRWFAHDPDKFDDFARQYRAELAGRADAVDALLDAVDRRRPLTLLFAARDPAITHARVLAEHLRRAAARAGRRA